MNQKYKLLQRVKKEKNIFRACYEKKQHRKANVNRKCGGEKGKRKTEDDIYIDVTKTVSGIACSCLTKDKREKFGNV